MYFWPQKDGSVLWTGSFNQETYDAYMAEHGGSESTAGPDDEAETDQDDLGYEAFTVEELKAEIATRNEGREWADHLSSTGRKADLIAALEADDEGGAE